jgi:hypothetical protein
VVLTTRCNEKILFTKLEEKISLKKYQAKVDGLKYIYVKSCYLQEEIMGELPGFDINKTRCQQLITQSCKKMGFYRRSMHTKHPVLIMEVT